MQASLTASAGSLADAARQAWTAVPAQARPLPAARQLASGAGSILTPCAIAGGAAQIRAQSRAFIALPLRSPRSSGPSRVPASSRCLPPAPRRRRAGHRGIGAAGHRRGVMRLQRRRIPAGIAVGHAGGATSRFSGKAAQMRAALGRDKARQVVEARRRPRLAAGADCRDRGQTAAVCRCQHLQPRPAVLRWLACGAAKALVGFGQTMAELRHRRLRRCRPHKGQSQPEGQRGSHRPHQFPPDQHAADFGWCPRRSPSAWHRGTTG
jgi:hypothetical protein